MLLPQDSQAAPLENKATLETLIASLTEVTSSTVKAKGHPLAILENPDRLQEQLQKAYLYFTQSDQQSYIMSYAGEWFLDNFYIIQQSMQQVIEAMPPDYYNQLPKLLEGDFKNYPRVYQLAHALSQFLQCRLTSDEQRQFIETYQQEVVLTTGELWAWPTMLRLVEIEALSAALTDLMDGSTAQDTTPNLTVANCVISLRAINTENWQDFFEAVSRVEAILRLDPAYPQMDFETRDRYRRCIENLADHSAIDEEQVAQTVLHLAQTAAKHIGYYLIGAGLAQTKHTIEYHSAYREALAEWFYSHALALYLASIGLFTTSILFAVIRYTGGTTIQKAAVGLLVVVPATTIVTQIIHWLVTKLVSPKTLPKMDFSAGIPADYRTMVVIPALLTDNDEVDSLASQLELHYLRNPDPNLRFAILADYSDADAEHKPEDSLLLEQAKAKIEALNARYAEGDYQPFYFFLRKRQWNALEGKWMGYERKRGKLAEFNRLLLNPTADTSYTVKLGELSLLPSIRYVITLDSDTILPRESAHRLIGTFAHPLNQACFDSSKQQVVAGYTILQPRIEILPTVANQTPFTRLFAGENGMDLYTLAVSDVYQDLFGEGIYVGKGIYDVAAFEQSLAGKVPENSLLSHDLFEGLQGRAALVTDIVLFEDFPTHYLASTNRLHRWTRGDWQLLPWLLPHVASSFSLLDVWKILDNLNRSLLQPALFLIVLMSWLWLPGSLVFWTAFTLLVLLVPFFLGAINKVDARKLRLFLMRWVLSIIFLPHEALTRLDAIVVTLYRLGSRKHLLEWTTAARALHIFQGGNSRTVWRHMAKGLLLAGLAAGAAFALNPGSLLVALPLMALWVWGPSVADYISRPTEKIHETITEVQRRQLRVLARRTWLFFEEFVGPDDNWLPPDHYQEAPSSKIGHYTSPTNIGLLLLATLAAYDLGYIGLVEFTARLKLLFESVSQLERYSGHLLNWHNTLNLQPLLPRYVSTVDNGNFASALLVLQQGCQELMHIPILRQQRWQGVIDTLDVLSNIIEQIEHLQPTDLATAAHRHLNAMRNIVLMDQQRGGNWVEQLDRLTEHQWKELSDTIIELVENVENKDAALFRDLRVYLTRLQHHLSNMRRDTDMLLPWFSALQNAPSDLTQAQDWQAFLDATMQPTYLDEISLVYAQIETQLHALQTSATPSARAWCENLLAALQTARQSAAALLEDLHQIQTSIDAEFQLMDFSILFDPERCLFHIGYHVDSEQLDTSYYDLLASEARLTSFLAIAKHDVPIKHWLQLSRSITQIHNTQTLLSWSGTMFEYLMPLLFMQDYENTLLHQSHKAVVDAQIRYGQQHNIPWGISESGYYAFDNNQNYQYRAFGLPSVALKRGQERDLVVTPYACIIALPLAPARVLENIQALIAQNTLTSYGFMEAVDYTGSRLPLGKEAAPVQEYMAHHQGMIFLALTNCLGENSMVRRFHSDQRIRSVEPLLMEKVPENPPIERQGAQQIEAAVPSPELATHSWEVPVTASFPQAHYLSNGRYSVMLTSGGGGYSQWGKRAVTRWRADTTLDDWGQWLYLHDNASGDVWSPTFQPIGVITGETKALFHVNQVEFQTRTFDISTRLEVLVPPEDDLEIRKLLLINHSDDVRQLTICSYAEMVLALQTSDQQHQAFNKMFIESEWLPELGALLFRRRLRSPHDEAMYVLHMVVNPQPATGDLQFETDRGAFLGRNRTYRDPSVFNNRQLRLSGTTGATLDPIMALAQTITLPAHSSLELAYLTLAGASRQEVLELAGRYRHWEQIEHSFNQSRYFSRQEMLHLGLKTNDIIQSAKLLSALLYPTPPMRATPEVLAANTKSQSGLWAYGISGDYPIMLVQVNAEEHLELVYDLVQTHRMWRNRGLDSTLVILNQRDTGYMQELYNQIHRLLVKANSETWINRHNGIFILRSEQLNDDDRTLLRTAARVLLNGEEGTLQQQLEARQWQPVMLPALTPTASPAEIEDRASPLERPQDLQFDNGIGGFSPDGHEYVLYIDREKTTPAPWCNVIANPKAGFLLSEAGGGFTWGQNSGEYRLTSWRNDPVVDIPGEAIYLRDEETALVWSPTPMPASTEMPYLVRHGAGYSTIEHQSQGLRQTTRFYMAPDAPVKFVRLHLKNTAAHPRRITVTYYMEWVLGSLRDISQAHLIPEFDIDTQTLLVRNPYNIEFGAHYAFITASQTLHGMTVDRTEFLGRMGSYAQPAGLRRLGLKNTVQAGLDPCAAIQLHVDLPIDGEAEVYFVIGCAQTRAEALELSQHHAKAGADAWENSLKNWRDILDSVVVRTPDQAMNVLLPWLLYQALSCRIWGRAGLYQAGGAYGFRDQLQDILALIHARPELAREHILKAARHQFEAGDVLHWWHPPLGRGVRTRFADDLLWLPFVVSQYVSMTGDTAILDAEEPFLKGNALRSDEEEHYGLYEPTVAVYSLYEHCRRAVNKGYTLGQHNLPLMRAGDWNDGMNLVGAGGQGESGWMGWFLYATLAGFSDICRTRGDLSFANVYDQQMQALQEALESAGWDGLWYLRAYYDDGTPLGSHQNEECQIDSLPQSWGILSGAASPARAELAMQAVQDHLICAEDGLIQLFTPPFNHTKQSPGYIKGYPPGIRENGGQYTHAALWVVWAFAKMSKGNLAQRLFHMLNPITHSDNTSKMEQYRVEPYVIAADIYSEAPHTGRGGWTWYTGSAAWMYRLGVEAILGLQREGSSLRIAPSTASDWSSYEVDYSFGESVYKITVLNPDHVESGVCELHVDGEKLPSNNVPLVDDGHSHMVKVILRANK